MVIRRTYYILLLMLLVVPITNASHEITTPNTPTSGIECLEPVNANADGTGFIGTPGYVINGTPGNRYRVLMGREYTSDSLDRVQLLWHTDQSSTGAKGFGVAKNGVINDGFSPSNVEPRIERHVNLTGAFYVELSFTWPTDTETGNRPMMGPQCNVQTGKTMLTGWTPNFTTGSGYLAHWWQPSNGAPSVALYLDHAADTPNPPLFARDGQITGNLSSLSQALFGTPHAYDATLFWVGLLLIIAIAGGIASATGMWGGIMGGFVGVLFVGFINWWPVWLVVLTLVGIGGLSFLLAGRGNQA